MARKSFYSEDPPPYRDYYQVIASPINYPPTDEAPSTWKKWCFRCAISVMYETGKSGYIKIENTGCCFSCLIVLLLILLFIVLPLIFMNSIAMQRSLVFRNWESTNDMDYANFKKYGIDGVRNFYVNVQSGNETVSLGIWQILPTELDCGNSLDNSQTDGNVEGLTDSVDFDYVLEFSDKPVLLLFHDESSNRASNVGLYCMLRNFFQIIAFDYRGYGDSTDLVLTEKSVVEDSMELYKWLKRKTTAEIFVWGHSLGASISTQTMVRLRAEGIRPDCVFLHSPFTTLKEEVETNHKYFKYFSWLPWFNQTVLDPLSENGFSFRTIEDILSIDCPVMIFHAEDDDVVSYELSEKLYQIAQDMRDYYTKGKVSLHVFPPYLNLGHNKIYDGSMVSDYIREQMEICARFKTERYYF